MSQLLLLIGLSILIILYIIKASKNFNLWRDAIAALILFSLIGGPSWTPDKEGYILLFSIGDRNYDGIFAVLNYLALNPEISYLILKVSSAIIVSVGLLIFAAKLNANNLIITIFFVATNYLYAATQLRYYPAYITSVICLILLFEKPSAPKRIILLILPVAMHFGTLIMSFIQFFVRKGGRRELLIIMFLSAIFFYDYLIILVDNYLSPRIESYFSEEGEVGASSIAGGVFTTYPIMAYLLGIVVFYGGGALWRMANSKNMDANEHLVSSCLIFTLLVMPFALKYQILAQRFLVPSILFFVVYAMTRSKDARGSKRESLYLAYLMCVILFDVIVKYLYLGNLSFFVKSLKIMESI